MSPAGNLDKEDLAKIAKGGVLAMLGALLAYLGSTVLPQFAHNYPEIVPFAAALISILLNLVRKWATDTRPTAGQGALAAHAGYARRNDQIAAEIAKAEHRSKHKKYRQP